MVYIEMPRPVRYGVSAVSRTCVRGSAVDRTGDAVGDVESRIHQASGIGPAEDQRGVPCDRHAPDGECFGFFRQRLAGGAQGAGSGGAGTETRHDREVSGFSVGGLGYGVTFGAQAIGEPGESVAGGRVEAGIRLKANVSCAGRREGADQQKCSGECAWPNRDADRLYAAPDKCKGSRFANG